MDLQYAILGLLAKAPLTGYDLKKIIRDTPFMPWSGNNNQIYRALIQLLELEYATNHTVHQDGLPSKKVYTITPKGTEALQDQLLTTLPEIPEFKKNFLIQLSAAAALNLDAILALLASYEQEIRTAKLMLVHNTALEHFNTSLPATETWLWEMCMDSYCLSCDTELAWIEKARKEIAERKKDEN